MKKKLHHRYLAVKHAVDGGKTVGNEPDRFLAELLSRKPCPDPDVRRATEIYACDFKREVLEAFLLVDATPEEINDVLRVKPEVTQAYAHFFFDTEVFDDELDRLEYAHNFSGNAFGEELKKYAVSMGKECLKIRMGRGTYATGNSDVQSGIRATAFMMTQLARTNAPDSGIAKEALNWAKVGLKAASEEVAQPETSEDILITLRTNELTVSAKGNESESAVGREIGDEIDTDVPPPEDILH